MENTKSDELQLNISSEQMNRIEQALRQKQPSHHKKSMEKRSSVKIKNVNRQSLTFNRNEMTALDTLSSYLENVQKNIELIDQICLKRRIYFLSELKSKITLDEYKAFLSNLDTVTLIEGAKLQEQGKYHNYHYIIIEGSIAAYRQRKANDEEKEFVEAFQFEVGEAVLSNTLQTHKFNPYTIKAKKLSILLRCSEENYIRYIKKAYLKEVDELSSFLCHTLPFRGITANEMKKYIPFCSFKRFTYNELVYSEGDLIKQLFLILHGQAEIGYEASEPENKDHKKSLTHSLTPNLYKVNHQAKDKKEIKIVKVGKRQLFGLEFQDTFKESYYQHHARVTSDSLKVLSIGLDVLYDIQMENPSLEDNMNSYLKKITTIHNNLFEKCQKVNIDAPPKKKKKKRKLKKRSEISLQWWGLAEKIEGSKKYRLPTPPHSSSQKCLVRKEPLMLQNRTSKLDYFKRRLFEDEMEGLEQLQEKQNDEPNYPHVLIPRLQKVKIKMINPKPKVINNAQRIKRKLVQYAKNGEIYCDKLQLQ